MMSARPLAQRSKSGCAPAACVCCVACVWLLIGESSREVGAAGALPTTQSCGQAMDCRADGGAHYGVDVACTMDAGVQDGGCSTAEHYADGHG